mgnify:CR=1 FL=1
MNYREALAWLYGAQTFGIKLGLENIRRLLEAAGNPQERLRFIHVAGTNGKGSTCAMLDAALRAGGLSCGFYSSPHLVDFRERIRIGGGMIPEDAVAAGLTLLRDAARGWDHAPTFFEIATALAAWWFAREGAEVVVWETGLGGRLDATNAVMPLVSVITPVGLDHQQWLGASLAEIAAEKAGILKPGVPAVSAPQAPDVRAVLESRAAASAAPLRFVEEAYGGPVGLAGGHQRWNAALALAALDAAGLVRDEAARRAGLASVEWPGRFQRIGSDLVIDGAHNPQAAEALVETWREVFGPKRARLIFGALRDKDASALLRRLREIADEVWLTTVANPRAVPSGELRALAEDAGFVCVREAGVAQALAAARAAGGPALVAGSLFLAGEALAALEGRTAPAVSAQ